VLPTKSQRRAPLCEAIQKFHLSQFTIFTSPGHKAGRAVDPDVAKRISRDAYRYDVSMMNGIDDRTASRDVQGQAEELAASLYGADPLILFDEQQLTERARRALRRRHPTDEVVVARNAHKSLAGGLIFSGQKPRFVYPEYDEELDLVHALDPEHLDAELTKYKKAKGVIVVNPDYYVLRRRAGTRARDARPRPAARR